MVEYHRYVAVPNAVTPWSTKVGISSSTPANGDSFSCHPSHNTWVDNVIDCPEFVVAVTKVHFAMQRWTTRVGGWGHDWSYWQ